MPRGYAFGPIIMTSLAFIFGIGADVHRRRRRSQFSALRRTGIIGGMIMPAQSLSSLYQCSFILSKAPANASLPQKMLHPKTPPATAPERPPGGLPAAGG